MPAIRRGGANDLGAIAAIQAASPGDAAPGRQFQIAVSQLNAAGALVGGASVLYVVRPDEHQRPSGR